MDRVDLNADLGESFGPYTYGADRDLLSLVTSANVACGFHGGDPEVMHRAVALAKQRGVAVGAHPGYRDREGFGRRYLAMTPGAVTDSLLYQIGALESFCRAEGTRVAYVKPHGALYNAAAKEESLAQAIVEGLVQYGGGLTLLCPAGSAMERAAEKRGVPTAREFFADRGYEEDGSLVSRSQPGAVITDPEEVCARVLQAVREGTVTTRTGGLLSVKFDSICLHGDNPSAVELAKKIRASLVEAGVQLLPFAGV